MYVGPDEEQRLFATRLERYRVAVREGFYNESAETVPYRGFHILPMDGLWHVMQNGSSYTALQTPHVAKVWITCRLDNLTFSEANRKVRAE